MEDSFIIGLSDEIIEQTIEIRKQYKIITPDAIIAATALVNKLAIITRNMGDFGKIEGVEVIDL
jgi:predicted nucleic acid-binding protein